jgi:hypothetical protein
LETTIYLENVGLAAIGRMAHTLSMLPKAGTVTGKIMLSLHGMQIDCTSDLTLSNVAYVVDAEGLTSRQRTAIARALDDFRANGKVLAGCDGSLDDVKYRPINAFQSAVNLEVAKSAPPLVRQVAIYDRRRLTEDAPDSPSGGLGEAMSQAMTTAVEQEIADRVTKAAVGAFGQRFGGAFAQGLTTGGSPARPAPGAASAPQLQPQQKTDGNAIGKGVKAIGSGFKKLFGGGKKDEKKKKKKES